MGSFRQLLLVAFMLIAALLGGTALRAVVILDRLMAQSAEEAARALELHAAVQSLAARTAAMERAARQSLVLNDSVLRTRFRKNCAPLASWSR
jgi:two-component system sensor histidine kinase GlrK